MSAAIALVGDYSATVVAHQAIPRALALAGNDLQLRCAWEWIRTRDVQDAPRELARFSAVWVVPASPYENMDGALAAIRFARETGRPFLGTCGGFQHALIEFARNVSGLPAADHAETNPTSPTAVVTPLACALREKSGDIRLTVGSRLREIYGREFVQEGYHCSYGVSPEHRPALERAGLRFTAFDCPNSESRSAGQAGDIRGAELAPEVHPFFIGTLFQPERAALRNETPPLVRAFVAAAGAATRRNDSAP